MSKKVSKERYVDVLLNGSEKDAERLCYDLLLDDLDSIFKRERK